MNTWRKLHALLRRQRTDAEMSEEMRAHLELQAAENERRGMSAEEARYAARRAFGGVEQIKERARDQRAGAGVERVVMDLRYAVRALWKSPRSTAIAVLTLGLGIGLVTIQFSIVNAVQRGLPFADAGRIVLTQALDQNGRVQPTPLADFLVWREAQRSFVRLAAFASVGLELGDEARETRSYRGAAFSAGVLELLGVAPILGRGFTREDERADAPPVVLLGHRVWQNDFGGDPAIVGREVRLQGEPATVIGIMPEGFGFPENEQAWVNLRPSLNAATRPGVRTTAQLLGRLRDDVTLEVARAEFDLLVRRSESGNPVPVSRALRVRVRPVIDPDGGKAGLVALALLGVVGGVMALACLNVANLLSARALQRSAEIALRSALGADRRRLLQQLLTESFVLALLGAAVGGGLAIWGVPLVNREFAAVPDKPFWFTVSLDWRVLAFAVALTFVVGVLAGLFPALRATRRNTVDLLKGATDGGGAGMQLGRVNRLLVVAQLALSSAVLIAASVLVNAVWRTSRTGLAFDPATVASAELRLSTKAFAEPVARVAFFDEVLTRIRAVPGVASATLTDRYPVERSGVYRTIEVEGGIGDALERGPVVSDAVAAGFFRDLQIPVREGREFLATDSPQGERIAVVNESFARMAWPNGSAVGERFRPSAEKGDEPWVTVVGVAADLASDRTPRASAYYHVPLSQSAPTRVLLYVRTNGSFQSVLPAVREVIRTLSPDVPFDRPMSLGARIDERIAPLRIFGALSIAFGVSALFLAAVGVYGVTAFSVQRRTREFGIRVALGAKPADLLRFVFTQGLRQLALGLIVGAILGWGASRPVLKAVSSLSATPAIWAYLTVLGVVSVTVALALWLPARRAAKVDPMVALRAEG